MAVPTRPAQDAIIDPVWGQWVHDNLNTVFATLAAAKAAVPTPPDGLRGYLLDEDSMIIGKGGTWRWWQKCWAPRTGNTEQIVWNANANAASCLSITSLMGRLYTVELNLIINTAATAYAQTVGTLQPGWFMTTRIDPGQTTGHSAGAGSGRTQISPSGAIVPTWAAADNPAASVGGHLLFQLVLADLRPA